MKLVACLATLSVSVLLFSLPCGGTEPNGQGGAQIQTNRVMAASTVKDGNTEDAWYPTALTLSSGVQPAKETATGFGTSRINAVLPDGTTYEGEWRNGTANGEGTATVATGTKQYGEWRDGKPYRVSGKSVFPDGTVEVGTWNYDGTVCGGTIIWKDGRQYKGDWKLSENAPELPNGHGEMTWPDGRKYVGQFRDGTMDGRGKMTYPNAKVEEGSWKDGKFVGSAP